MKQRERERVMDSDAEIVGQTMANMRFGGCFRSLVTCGSTWLFLLIIVRQVQCDINMTSLLSHPKASVVILGRFKDDGTNSMSETYKDGAYFNTTVKCILKEDGSEKVFESSIYIWDKSPKEHIENAAYFAEKYHHEEKDVIVVLDTKDVVFDGEKLRRYVFNRIQGAVPIYEATAENNELVAGMAGFQHPRRPLGDGSRCRCDAPFNKPCDDLAPNPGGATSTAVIAGAAGGAVFIVGLALVVTLCVVKNKNTSGNK